jgi:hypothetical protein
MVPLRLPRVLAIGTLVLGACSASDEVPERLGPKDGHELAPADTGRVAVGDPAPDFSLEAYRGEIVTLSDYRGSKDVILVFYRGHW